MNNTEACGANRTWRSIGKCCSVFVRVGCEGVQGPIPDTVYTRHEPLKHQQACRETVPIHELTSLITGSKTSLLRRFPGIASSPLKRPTLGSSGSSTLKQVKWNIVSKEHRKIGGYTYEIMCENDPSLLAYL